MTLPTQIGKNVQVNFKAETTLNTLPGATGATQFRPSASAGLALKKTNVMPTEFRPDGMAVQARHGSRSVDGEYAADLMTGVFDALFAAGLTGTWLPSFTLTSTDFTSTTTGANTIVFAANSPITKGVRVGDVIVMTASVTAANKNRNLRVTGLSATTITVAETLTVAATADTTTVIKVTKRLTQSNPPVPASFTFEEYFQDIDASQVFTGCRVVGVTLSFKVDATVAVTFKLVGIDEVDEPSASAPYFTSPTTYTSTNLVCSDGVIRVNGADTTLLTGLDITIDRAGKTGPGIGTLVSPDVYIEPAKISGTMTAKRADLSMLALFSAETQFDIAIMCVEPMSEPKNFMSLYMGNVKIVTGAGKPIGGDGAMSDSLPINIGIDQTGTSHSVTMIQANSSAA